MADGKFEYLSHLWKSCLNWVLNSSLNLPGIKKGAQASLREGTAWAKAQMGGSMVCVSGSICFRSGSASRPWAERLLGSWVPCRPWTSEVLGYKDLGVSPGSVLLSDPGHHLGNHEDPTGRPASVLDAARHCVE